jgi:bifunctional DNA-binding transcriptional regulator/antitoxin component of YhaV-PrlF toxin-antitoxin module
VVVDTAPHGPRKVGAKGQITLPEELLTAIGAGTGANVWVTLNPDRPGTLVIIPQALMMEVFRKGWTALS